ncbi:hypothetical protein GOP47_0014515 [Adiantum capillus-veneris]|uniref:Exportin-4 n=1 Tax=Adiantum capillus-veneris TaxID=13818 RepID=A0A9D4ULY0_ADICA|nr:hypothetical protein GOP47_0014515 [Adiantum capillus-veneris]
MGPGDVESSNSQAAIMQTFEQACAALQIPHERAAGELVLLAFRRSPQPFEVCQFIMEHSQMANARFQAAAALQESAIREWGLLTADEKTNMRIYCLHYVMARAAASEAYVQLKVSAVAAVLMKRGWLEMVATEKEAFFEEVKQAVFGTHGLAGQIAGISFLESLVSEFSPSTASAMGLSAEFHEHCRASLELDFLQRFYAWALKAAYSVADKILQNTSTQLEVHVCASALRFMSQVLSWEFQGTLVHGAGGVIVMNKTRSNAFSVMPDISRAKCREPGAFVQPGSTWQESVLSSNHTNWILHFYSCIRERAVESDWIDSPLCVSARQLILQLSCLNGHIFPSDNGITQEEHLQRLLIGITTWISPPIPIISAIKNGKSESELLDGCRALGSIASLTSPAAFDSFLKPSGSIFNLLSSLTIEVIRALGEPQGEEQTWTEEALESLLDVWSHLLQPADLSKRISLPQYGIEAAAEVFRVFVQTQLKAAAASADEEGDESEQLQAVVAARDERLSAIALIARASPRESVALLATLLSERYYFTCQHKEGNHCPTSVLEELHWILLMSGHVLADPGEGETPMIPDTFLTQFPENLEAANHPIVLLSRSAIMLAQKSLDAFFQREIFSPRLMEAIVWFFGRWTDTYLLASDGGKVPNSTPSGAIGSPQENLTTRITGSPVVLAFSVHGDGRSALECLVQLAGVALTSWPGERTLLEITCFQLLPGLSRRRNVCRYLVASEGWQHFAKAFAYLDQTLLVLPSSIQRGLAEVLCRSATGLSSVDVANQFLRDLLSPLTLKILELSHTKDLSTCAQKPDAILLVTNLLERLRGAARATMPRTQKAMFEIGVAVMEPLLIFLECYKNQSMVVYVLLKFVVDWVDGQVAFLEAKETATVFSFSLRLLQTYSVHNVGKISVNTSRALQTESQVEKYKDLRALLQLLTNLSSKDLIDFASDNSTDEENPDIAQVIYLGLHIIIPLISVDLLKYPKLCRQYFTLLAHMLEVYPEKIAKLSKEGFGQVVGALQFGLRHQDIEVVNMSLTALNAIAFYHYQSMCKGEEGLGQHALEGHDSTGAVHEGVLDQFLRSLLQYLLFENYSNELVEPASDALLPLILCNPSLYQRLARDLLEGQHNVMLQGRLAAAFHMLMTGNQVTSSLDRTNRRRFRENLHLFLAEVRGFLCFR